MISKKLLLFAGLAGILSASGCVSIFNAMSNDFTAETGYVGQRAEQQYENSNELKVITYNLAHCRGSYDFYGNNERVDELNRMDDLDMDLTINSPEQVYKCLDDVAEMLIRENADIVLLQEVDKKAVWSYDIDFMPYLAEKAGMDYYAYGSKYDFAWWPFEHRRANGEWIDTLYFNIGNAVMSKYPIVSADNKAFNEQGFIGWIAGEERYLDTVIDINGEQARFISTHFGDGLVESRKMVEEARESAMPFVFGGTLHLVMPAARETCRWTNEKSVGGAQALIDSGLFNMYMQNIDPLDATYFTSDTENMYWTADYIIPTMDVEITDYHVVDVELSDHMPVAATLVFEETE
ncbi:MAG: endonuclease/exonuclease/phosphatase family protein [Candidatus Nanoarchaeia archaeon]|jgi:endonuclease/exonuclease/phosphatase family metal-dependent hydrolase